MLVALSGHLGSCADEVRTSDSFAHFTVPSESPPGENLLGVTPNCELWASRSDHPRGGPNATPPRQYMFGINRTTWVLNDHITNTAIGAQINYVRHSRQRCHSQTMTTATIIAVRSHMMTNGPVLTSPRPGNSEGDTCSGRPPGATTLRPWSPTST